MRKVVQLSFVLVVEGGHLAKISFLFMLIVLEQSWEVEEKETYLNNSAIRIIWDEDIKTICERYLLVLNGQWQGYIWVDSDKTQAFLNHFYWNVLLMNWKLFCRLSRAPFSCQFLLRCHTLLLLKRTIKRSFCIKLKRFAETF